MRWRPPTGESRVQSAGPPVVDPTLARLTTDSAAWALFEPLNLPSSGDWLATGEPGEKDRRGQTFAQFTRPGPHRTFPTRRRTTIELVPYGATGLSDDHLAMLAECVRAHYCLPCRTGRPLPADAALAACGREAGYGPQLTTEAVHADLARGARPDAFITLAITAHDLTKHAADWNFVFGEASHDTGTGVFSFARYREGASSDAHFLRRCCMVLVHEIGHLFGIRHCVWARCVMNGSNHLGESESRPFALCPTDLRKLADTLARGVGGFDPLARERAIRAFFERAGFDADAAEAGRRVALLEAER